MNTSGREPATGSLRLPDEVGVSAAEAAAVANRWNTIGRVNDRLAAAGMTPNVVPEAQYITVTVEQLMTGNINDFTALYHSQLRWYGYANRLLADIRATLLQVDNEMKDISLLKRKFYREFNESKEKKDRVSKDDIDIFIESDAQYRDLKVEEQDLTQMRMKVEAWVEELESSMKAVSRQIENRRGETVGGNREQNMPNHHSGRWHGPQPLAPQPGPGGGFRR